MVQPPRAGIAHVRVDAEIPAALPLGFLLIKCLERAAQSVPSDGGIDHERVHNENFLIRRFKLPRRTGVYIDLYLIHWPNPSQGQFVEAWQALVDAQKQGIVKHIGVSNFLPGHIDLLIRSTGVTPAVNQVELYPFFQQAGQRAYDQAHGIITEAWSPLGHANQMLKDPTIVRIAAMDNLEGRSFTQDPHWHEEA